MREYIPTGNEVLDLRLGGGYPHPSYIVIEGDNGSGKSAVTQQFIYGALRKGYKVFALVTERSGREYLNDMSEIQLDVLNYFIVGSLKIVTANLKKLRWSAETMLKALNVLSKYFEKISLKYDFIVVDALTHLIHQAPQDIVLDFMKDLRQIVKRDVTVIVTIHPKALSEDLRSKVFGLCDVYIRLDNVDVGGRTYKLMSLVKMKGFGSGTDTSIIFDVDPALGLKVVPLKATKA